MPFRGTNLARGLCCQVEVGKADPPPADGGLGMNKTGSLGATKTHRLPFVVLRIKSLRH